MLDNLSLILSLLSLFSFWTSYLLRFWHLGWILYLLLPVSFGDFPQLYMSTSDRLYFLKNSHSDLSGTCHSLSRGGMYFLDPGWVCDCSSWQSTVEVMLWLSSLGHKNAMYLCLVIFGYLSSEPSHRVVLGSPIFPSGCEGKLGVALESLQGRRDLT